MGGEILLKYRRGIARPLKTVYYSAFLFFIVAPILVVLIIALMYLNWQFKEQAIENIKQAQETIMTELMSDINTMSMRLSHIVYTNNNEILDYAAGTDTSDASERYDYEQKLYNAGSLALEPTKNIISVGFYMKNGRKIHIKNEINRSITEIKETKWYQKALENPNTVCIGAYDTAYMNDLFTGGKKDLLILVYALSPDITTDRSQKMEMVTVYQSALAGERIKLYNNGYISGENKLGITHIRDSRGNIIFSTVEEERYADYEQDAVCVSSSMQYHDTTWCIESYVKSKHLTGDYWDTAFIILGAAIIVLALAGYYSTYFLRSMVKPIEEMSTALRQVEEGNLTVHISPSGQSELRTMIHSFNAMVRRLKILIDDYEEKIKSAEKTPEDYFAAMIKGEITSEEVSKQSEEFFKEHFALLGFWVENTNYKENDTEYLNKLLCNFQRNSRFSSRCLIYIETPRFFIVFYRILEKDYKEKVIKMIEDLQKSSSQQLNVQITACIGQEKYGFIEFNHQVEEIRQKMCLRHLKGPNGMIDLNDHEEVANQLLQLSHEYERLASALYIADEKNMVQEKEKLLEQFGKDHLGEARIYVLAAILAIATRFSADNANFSDLFGQKYDYIEKLKRLEDIRSLKLWVTNYFAWIMDYSASKLNVSETDVIIKAKHYIADHFDDAELSLAKVAEYVGLNEKYFANRFSKEAGETFLTYLTGLRMQKAKELLKTTTFKVYEIAELVGYHNVEHFNRVFKKLNDITPAQYRKTM